MANNIGGKLQGVSLDAFLQMAQTEQLTCTLSVASGDEEGLLFLQQGKLISAEVGELTNAVAAYRIISWETSVIEIKESCEKTVDEIKQPLMNILMEAMRIRDEAESDPTPETSETSKTKPGPAPGKEKPEPDPAETTSQTDDPPEKLHDEAQPVKAVEEKTKPLKKEDVGSRKIPPGEKKIAKPGRKKRKSLDTTDSSKRFAWKYIIVGFVLLLTAGVTVAHILSSSKRQQLAFETLISKVDATDASERKLNLLNAYVRENPGGKYSADVNRRIEALLKQEALKGFEVAEREATELAANGNFEAAVAVYEKYTDPAKGADFAARATTAIETFSERIEERDFEEMQAAASLQGPERLSLYQAFLEKYPDGNHRESILDLISTMENEYYLYMERRILENEKAENWETCLDLSRQFVKAFPDSDHADTLNNYIIRCLEEIQAARAFEQLSKRAVLLGEDWKAAMAVYSDYLEAYPKTPATSKIEREIEKLAALIEEARLADALSLIAQKVAELDSRFTLENDETVLDKKTGLMWCLLDSRAATNTCMTYEDATAYVSSLETGGNDDWRLPTPEELSALYQKQPPFPVDSQMWYWSSKTQKRYVGQWIIDVTIIDSSRSDTGEALTRESWECGAVRAVRRP